MNIAIIGSGISGLGAAYLLSSEHKITVFEKNNYAGGHARTTDIVVKDQKISVDTGFIVFNDRNYPNLLGLFNLLQIPYEKSDMSFGVSIDEARLEYSSNNMFADIKNIARPGFWKLLRDILQFNKQALTFVEHNPDISLGDCLQQLKLGDWFRDYYLLAMGAAIWSCPLDKMLNFPAKTFVQFFHNHGLLTINDHPQWYTVSGGSRNYVDTLTKSFKENIKLNCAVKSVMNTNNGYSITTNKDTHQYFDHVVFACHANEALEILQSPYKDIENCLRNFHYQNNRIVLHSDSRFMPENKKCWSSWVYLSSQKNVSLSYWMNNLQNLETELPVIITLNPQQEPDPGLIYEQHEFSHPVFYQKAITAQQSIDTIQGDNNLWFCGAYQRYGFHEDGLLSAVNIAQSFGIQIPWH